MNGVISHRIRIGVLRCQTSMQKVSLLVSMPTHPPLSIGKQSHQYQMIPWIPLRSKMNHMHMRKATYNATIARLGYQNDHVCFMRTFVYAIMSFAPRGVVEYSNAAALNRKTIGIATSVITLVHVMISPNTTPTFIQQRHASATTLPLNPTSVLHNIDTLNVLKN